MRYLHDTIVYNVKYGMIEGKDYVKKISMALLEEKTGIREEVLDEIVAIAEKYDIRKVILFGSRARGDYRERSDIDLAVFGQDYPCFSLDVDDTTSTLLKYDFVDMDHSVQKELKESIEKEGIVLYEKI